MWVTKPGGKDDGFRPARVTFTSTKSLGHASPRAHLTYLTPLHAFHPSPAARFDSIRPATFDLQQQVPPGVTEVTGQ